MFAKKIDKRSRKAMIAFLTKHFRYYTMNPWNNSTSYANNVKVYNLDVPEKLKNKAYDFVYAECNEYDWDIRDRIQTFYDKTGYTAGFNGRSGGYIVMYDTERKENTIYTKARGIDEYADFDDWSLEMLRERVDLVLAFDKLCDDIRDIFIYYLENVEVKTITVMKPETKTIAVLNDCESEA